MTKPACHRMMLPMLLLSATCVIAAEATQRPDVGDYIPSYASTKCGGIDDGVEVGKTTCYTCRAGQEPIFYVFAKRPSEALVTLVKKIETLVIAKKDENAAAVVNFVGDPEDQEAREDVADFGAKHDLNNVSLTITKDASKFHLNQDDEVTVILFENGIIRLRNSAGSGALDEKVVGSIIRRSKALLD